MAPSQAKKKRWSWEGDGMASFDTKLLFEYSQHTERERKKSWKGSHFQSISSSFKNIKKKIFGKTKVTSFGRVYSGLANHGAESKGSKVFCVYFHKMNLFSFSLFFFLSLYVKNPIHSLKREKNAIFCVSRKV